MAERGVDTPRIVKVERQTVRAMRVRFTGADAFKTPVEVRAYGSLIGHWFPAGTLPSCVAPSSDDRDQERPRQARPRVRAVQPGPDDFRPAQGTRPQPTPSELQAHRDALLRRINRGG